MRPAIFFGVDPGASGAIAVIDKHGNAKTMKLSNTMHDVAAWLDEICDIGIGRQFAYLEQVNAMPKQGLSSTFKFGQSYGACEALLVCHGIPFERVTPVKWQTAMKCRSKGDKNVTKRRAQELFPGEKVTHAIADALLLAEYCRRMRAEIDTGVEVFG